MLLIAQPKLSYSQQRTLCQVEGALGLLGSQPPDLRFTLRFGKVPEIHHCYR